MSDVKRVHTSAGDEFDVKDNAARSMLAPIEASATASQAYAVGELLVYNGLLYKATAAIAQGDTITPDTNCTTTKLGTEVAGSTSGLATHASNGDIHVTEAQKTAWTGKQDALTFDSTPTANSSNPVTSGGVRTALESAGKEPYVYTFTAANWTAQSGGGSTIVIPAATHGITADEIIFQFWHLVSGAYLFNTWGVIESWATIDTTTHDITLHFLNSTNSSTKGYAGKVVLYG